MIFNSEDTGNKTITYIQGEHTCWVVYQRSNAFILLSKQINVISTAHLKLKCFTRSLYLIFLHYLYDFIAILRQSWFNNIPRRKTQTLTVKPDSLDGVGLSGNSKVLKLSLSSIPGRMLPSFNSISSWLLTIW